MTRRTSGHAFAFCAILFALGCDKATPPIPTASVVIDQVAPHIVTGATLQFTGAALDASGNPIAGRALTWKSSDTTRIAISATGLATWKAPGGATIIGQSGAAADSVTTTTGGDFAISDVVFTQGVQDQLGTIPMIKNGNPVAVLVMLTTPAAVTTPMKVTLNLLNADNSLAYTTSATVNRTISAAASSAAPTVALVVPPAQIKSNLKWVVIRDPDGDTPDDSLANDAFPRAGAATLLVQDVPALNLRLVPVVLASHGDAQPFINESFLPGYLQTARSALPLGQINTTIGTQLVTSASFGVPPNGGGGVFWSQVLSELELARVAAVGVDPTTHWYGVVSPPTGFNNTQFGGQAYLGSSTVSGAVAYSGLGVRTGWFFNQTQARDLVAHELSHNFGRRHAPCGGASGTDPNFPSVSGHIGEVMHDVFGWPGPPIAILAIPATTGDVMSYCFPQWASIYTYTGVIFGRGPGILAGAGGVAATRTTIASDVIAIQGTVSLDGRARPTLLPIVQLRGRQMVPDAVGEFRLSGFDAAGRQLFDYPFTPTAIADQPGVAHFTFALPLDARTQSLARVRVSGPSGSAELAEPLGVTSNAPVARRIGGRLTADCGAGVRAALQDEVTGHLLGVSSSGSVSVSTRSSRVAVSCARGVQSSRRAFTLP
jgi:hypothetical protein